MAANVNIVVNAQDRASSTLRKIRTAFGEIIQVALGVRLARVFQEAGESVRAFARNSISATADLQHFVIGIETLIAREQILAGVTDDMGEALQFAEGVSADYVSQLQEIALLSPFQFGDVQKVVRQAMAFGFAHDEAMEFAEATLNVAAGVGASNDMLRRMSYNLAQIRLQGKVTKLDVRQLALAGFDLNSVLSHIGDTMDVEIENYKDFNAAIKSGQIVWEDFAQGYLSYSKKYFGEASERMARTMFGLRNTFKDIFGVLMPQIFRPAMDSFTGQMSSLLDIILRLKDSGKLDVWGKNLKASYDKWIYPVFEYLLHGNADTDNPIVALILMFRHLKREGILGPIWATIFEQLTGINVAPLQNFVIKMQTVFDLLRDGEGILSDNVLGNIGEAFGLEANVLPDLKAKIIAWVQQVWTDIKTVFTDPLGADTANILGSLFGIDPEKIMEIQAVIQTVVDWIVEQWNTLKPGLTAIWDGIKEDILPIIAILGIAIGWIATEIAPILLDVFEQIVEWFGGNDEVFATFIDGIRNLGMIIAGVLVAAWLMLKPVLEAVLPFLINAVTSFLDLIMLLVGGDLEGAVYALGSILTNIILGVLAGIRALIMKVVESIWDLFNIDMDWATWWDNLRKLGLIIAYWFFDLLVKISQWIPNLIEKGKELINNFIAGAKDTWNTFKDITWPEWWALFIAAIMGPLADMFGIGGDAILGFVEGIEDKIATVKERITTAFTGIIGWFKDLLGISSPSQVFMEFGQQSLAGFMAGLQPKSVLSVGMGAVSATARGMGMGGGAPVIVNNNYHGLTLNDRIQAERDLRPIVQKLTRDG